MDQSYENVCFLINELVDLRTRAPQLTSGLCEKNTKQLLKCLKEVNIKLQEDEISSSLPDNPFEDINFRQLSQLDENLRVEIYKQIQLLRILIKKRKSPICQIIDEI